jgi:hypothetical protein
MYSVSVAKITNQVKILFPYFNIFFSIYVFLISRIINTSCGTVALYGPFFFFSFFLADHRATDFWSAKKKGP